MLRWCPSSFHVSRGYGAGYTRVKSPRLDASKPRGISTRAHSIKSNAVTRKGLSITTRITDKCVNASPFLYDPALPQDPTPYPLWCISLPANQEPTLHASSSNVFSPSLPVRLSANVLNPVPTSATPPRRLAGPANRRLSIATHQGIHHRPSTVNQATAVTPGEGPKIDVSLSQLTARLSGGFLEATVFSKPIIDDMVALYRSCRSRGVLRGLSEKDFEVLLSICGVFMASTEVPTFIPFRVKVETSGVGRKGYWDFMLEVVEDKAGFLELSTVDRYWRTRGLLHGFEGRPQVLNASAQILPQQILEDYATLKNSVEDPSFHLAFFRAAYGFGTHLQLVDASRHLCDLLNTMPCPTSVWTELFWKYQLVLTGDVPGDVQQRFLSVLESRLKQSTSATPHRHPPDAAQKRWLPTQHFSLDAIVSTFASAIFDCYASTHISPYVRTWAHEQTHDAIAMGESLSIRWANSLLLARTMVPAVDTRTASPSPPRPSLTSNGIWKAILVLSTLENTIQGMSFQGSLPRSVVSQIRPVSHSLWQGWAQADPGESPSTVKLAVATSFFKVASLTKDRQLLEDGALYCGDHGLFSLDGGRPAEPARSQVVAAVSAYACAMGSCQGRYNWTQLFAHVYHVVPDLASKSELISYIIPLLLPHNLEHAASLIQFAHLHKLDLSPQTLHPFAKAMAEAQQWSIVVPLLQSGQFTHKQSESVLITIFRDFQTSRVESIHVRLAYTLGNLLLDAYSNITPSLGSKYPVRHFLRLLIAAGHGDLAVEIMKRVFSRDPALFSQRSVRRYLVELVDRERQGAAVQLFKTAYLHYTIPQGEDFRRKLMTALIDARARAHANDVAAFCAPKPSSFKASASEKMLRVLLERSAISKSRLSAPCKRKTLLGGAKGWRHRLAVTGTKCTRRISVPTTKRASRSKRIMRILSADPHPSATAIRTAVSILSRHGRSLDALRVFSRFGGSLDRDGKAALGNIILHGLLQKHIYGPRRIVRRLFKLKDELASQCDFKPDRTTVNILVKALIVHHVRNLRALFNWVVGQSYLPRTSGVPPFTGARPFRSRWLVRLPRVKAIEQPLNFKRHVEPLYRTFIRHFHVKGDKEAAGIVIGLLKAGELADLERREAHSRSRRMGVIHKKAREQGRFVIEDDGE